MPQLDINKNFLILMIPMFVGFLLYPAFLVTSVANADTSPGTLFPSLGNAHVESVDDPHPPYNTNPPTSGHHLKYVAKWAIHSEPIPKELQVHNLEDGGVIMQYNCPEGCPKLVENLEAVFAQYQQIANAEVPDHVRQKNPYLRSKYHHLVLAPYPGMDTKIALTAWQRIDTFDSYDKQRIVRFIEAYIGIDHHPPRRFPTPQLPEGMTLPPP
ncbi:MAG: hypothetical protein CMH81_02785 [Nitrospiraceae bacterium]|jgi:hypothetical protein|nr:hypothetical protein [Nitrospiraceae bacterium]|tara:strand:+ start:1550 stop:2188 length:639 start_codon:yes stop_codon:yes gene_type:complete